MQNLPNHSLEQLYRKCLETVSTISGIDSEKSTKKYLQEMVFFNQDTTYLNAVYGIMDMSNLSFKYIANTEIALGIPAARLRSSPCMSNRSTKACASLGASLCRADAIDIASAHAKACPILT